MVFMAGSGSGGGRAVVFVVRPPHGADSVIGFAGDAAASAGNALIGKRAERPDAAALGTKARDWGLDALEVNCFANGLTNDSQGMFAGSTTRGAGGFELFSGGWHGRERSASEKAATKCRGWG